MARILLDAICSGNVSLARDIIQDGCYRGVDSQTSRRDGTALFFCCTRGYLDLALLLLGKNANVNARNKCLATPLHAAADNNHLKVVRLLIERGASINAQTHRGDTPLHLSAFRGHADIAQYLVEHGADFLLVNESNVTAAAEATVQGHLEVGQYLNAVRIRDYYNKHQSTDFELESNGMIHIDPPPPSSVRATVVTTSNDPASLSHVGLSYCGALPGSLQLGESSSLSVRGCHNDDNVGDGINRSMSCDSSSTSEHFHSYGVDDNGTPLQQQHQQHQQQKQRHQHVSSKNIGSNLKEDLTLSKNRKNCPSLSLAATTTTFPAGENSFTHHRNSHQYHHPTLMKQQHVANHESQSQTQSMMFQQHATHDQLQHSHHPHYNNSHNPHHDQQQLYHQRPHSAIFHHEMTPFFNNSTTTPSTISRSSPPLPPLPHHHKEPEESIDYSMVVYSPPSITTTTNNQNNPLNQIKSHHNVPKSKESSLSLSPISNDLRLFTTQLAMNTSTLPKDRQFQVQNKEDNNERITKNTETGNDVQSSHSYGSDGGSSGSSGSMINSCTGDERRDEFDFLPSIPPSNSDVPQQHQLDNDRFSAMTHVSFPNSPNSPSPSSSSSSTLKQSNNGILSHPQPSPASIYQRLPSTPSSISSFNLLGSGGDPNSLSHFESSSSTPSSSSSSTPSSTSSSTQVTTNNQDSNSNSSLAINNTSSNLNSLRSNSPMSVDLQPSESGSFTRDSLDSKVWPMETSAKQHTYSGVEEDSPLNSLSSLNDLVFTSIMSNDEYDYNINDGHKRAPSYSLRYGNTDCTKVKSVRNNDVGDDLVLYRPSRINYNNMCSNMDSSIGGACGGGVSLLNDLSSVKSSRRDSPANFLNIPVSVGST